MKKYIALLFVSIFVFGCSRPAEKKPVLAKIGNYEITLDEFEREFRDSIYSKDDSKQSRTDFLNILIDRKLILQDAEAKGLDKDKDFLKMIEKFWEQSLLKLALDQKSREINNMLKITDTEIQDAYQNMLKQGKTDKSYQQAYEQVKWELVRQKQAGLINDWIRDLHEKSKVKVNYDLLK